jgi:hypothetical protein
MLSAVVPPPYRRKLRPNACGATEHVNAREAIMLSTAERKRIHSAF